MPDTISDLSPRLVWKFFAELACVPRQSKKEDRAVEWLVQTGRALGCEVETHPIDPAAGRPFYANVLLRKPATPGFEDRPVTALQAHIDMVSVKAEGSAHDFSRDPIALRIAGDEVRATGTTLGADNGVGLCAALAVLADPDLKHGPMEVLITVDEEAGMTGARHLPAGWLKAAYLLNLDSEEEGEATISCAGGMDSIGSRPVTWEAAPAGLRPFALQVKDLPGGHSGLEIHQENGNAIRVLAAALRELRSQAGAGLRLASIGAGNARNAVPSQAGAVFFAEPAAAARLEQVIAEQQAWQRQTLGALNPANAGLTLSLAPVDDSAASGDAPSRDKEVLSEADFDALLTVLETLPHGVIAMSQAVPGLVETSTNLALVRIRDNALQVDLLSRSSIDEDKHRLGDRIAEIFAASGFTHRTGNAYPGWKPVPDSHVGRVLKQAHLDTTGGVPLKISACHAGLECGLLAEAFPNLEMISFGPTIKGAHTPEERVDIKSVESFYKLLCRTLETM